MSSPLASAPVSEPVSAATAVVRPLSLSSSVSAVEVLLSLPSKTFLSGEYGALWGDPALMVLTEPRFELRCVLNSKVLDSGIGEQGLRKRGGASTSQQVHQQLPPRSYALPWASGSPAGRLWERCKAHLELLVYDLEFRDPHEGRGGFGASTAQWGFVYALSQIGKMGLESFQKDLGTWDFFSQGLKTYWETLSGETQGSGADWVGQMSGGLCYFDRSQERVEVFSWPFENLGFYLLRTGFKRSTHEHLKDLPWPHPELEERRSEMRSIMEDLYQSLRPPRGSPPLSWRFLDGISAFTGILGESLLIAESTQNQIRGLMEEGERRGNLWQLIRGCGARGEDVLVVFYDLCSSNLGLWDGGPLQGKREKEGEREFQKGFGDLGLETVAGEKDLALGFRIDRKA